MPTQSYSSQLRAMETLEQKQLMTTLSETLRDNVESHLTDPPHDLLLGSEGATTETEICTAAFPQTCHSTLIEHDGWEWNGDNPFAAVDWTGVHLGPKNGVLVSPDILISATHMGSMQIFGRPVQFHGDVTYDRDVVDFIDLPSQYDIRVNLLDEPLPSDIRPIDLPEPTDLADVADALVLTLTWEDTVHVGVAREAVDPGTYTTPYLLTRSDPNYPDLWEPGSGGDSGTGSFLVYGGELVAGSVMQGGTNKTRSGAWLGNPEAQQGISEAIETMGGQQFETADWQPHNVDAVLAAFEIDDTRQGGRRMRR